VLNASPAPPVVIDHGADRAVYKQLADLIRAQIEGGEFGPGQRLPAQKDYVREFGLSRATVDGRLGFCVMRGLLWWGVGGVGFGSWRLRRFCG
jgi:DNA-binding transcriptional MocR family regulator